MPDSAVITAAVLLIGNELLSGRTQDTNLSHIAKRLGTRGIRVAQARVIPDDAETIVAVINEMRVQHDLVFTTGGIGPTHDDITADCVAQAFSVSLPIHPKAKAMLLDYFEQRGIEANDDRLRMARIPQGAELVENSVSVAPGFKMENVFVFAGVPNIMRAMLESVLPSLPSGAVVESTSIKCNLGEGTIAAALRAIQDNHPTVDIGSYPGNMEQSYSVTVVARGTDTAELLVVETEIIASITELGGTVESSGDH